MQSKGKQHMETALSIFKALSDETRLRIVNLLFEQELCVCELMEALEMPQPRISHQLSILKAAGLVTDRREGRWIVYRLQEGEGLVSQILGSLRAWRKSELLERDRARLLRVIGGGKRWACPKEGGFPPQATGGSSALGGQGLDQSRAALP